MLQAYSFRAEPIIGHSAEKKWIQLEGFIICSAPDPEVFLQEKLLEVGLAVLEAHYTACPSPRDIGNLPETEKLQMENQGWCMVFQEIDQSS